MEINEQQAMKFHCPTCDAKPGEKCVLTTGYPRFESHRERREVVKDLGLKSPIIYPPRVRSLPR
jgi:hypothetical protein